MWSYLHPISYTVMYITHQEWRWTTHDAAKCRVERLDQFTSGRNQQTFRDEWFDLEGENEWGSYVPAGGRWGIVPCYDLGLYAWKVMPAMSAKTRSQATNYKQV